MTVTMTPPNPTANDVQDVFTDLRIEIEKLQSLIDKGASEATIRMQEGACGYVERACEQKMEELGLGF